MQDGVRGGLGHAEGDRAILARARPEHEVPADLADDLSITPATKRDGGDNVAVQPPIKK